MQASNKEEGRGIVHEECSATSTHPGCVNTQRSTGDQAKACISNIMIPRGSGTGCHTLTSKKEKSGKILRSWSFPMGINEGAGYDLAQHRLTEYPVFEEQHRSLMDVIGQNLSLPAVIGALLEDENKRNALVGFCDIIVETKGQRRGAGSQRIRRDRKGGRGDLVLDTTIQTKWSQDRDCPAPDNSTSCQGPPPLFLSND
ncbi:hypothetical protein K0M31_001848 [Melipona bicolor]|uniref:Uncharacterized protein n=1 Tax=Melipona bicolor TaxID=60889 RepID=A0AA40GGB8_9HYME|nr:hypothetical protein K0M31_001848 [Melipona bicolor]